MIKALVSVLICYSVCYGYPADHLVTFFYKLQKVKRDFNIYKSSKMLAKFTDKSSSEIDSIKNSSKKEISICCVVCHEGPANHFTTLLPELQKKGVQLHIHATPGVIEKLKNVDLQVQVLNLNNTSLSETEYLGIRHDYFEALMESIK